jgi:hypothetical protein
MYISEATFLFKTVGNINNFAHLLSYYGQASKNKHSHTEHVLTNLRFKTQNSDEHVPLFIIIFLQNITHHCIVKWRAAEQQVNENMTLFYKQLLSCCAGGI